MKVFIFPVTSASWHTPALRVNVILITAFGVATVAYSIDTKATWIVTRYVDIRSVILCRQRLKQYVRWRQCQTEYKKHQV